MDVDQFLMYIFFWLIIWLGKVCNRIVWNRNYGAKAIGFGVGARAAMLQGVSEVADAVKVTMGPKVLVLYSLALPFPAISITCWRCTTLSNNNGSNLLLSDMSICHPKTKEVRR